VSLGTHDVPSGGQVVFRGSTTVVHPERWSPANPHLYKVSISGEGVGGGAGYQVETGIRSVTVQKGRLMVNGRPANFRGGFFHEDSPRTGGAADRERMQLVIDRLKQVGGTLLRTHYPLDPYFHQLADRQGVFLWSEIPVYQLEDEVIDHRGVHHKAFRQMRENILDKASHPSVLTWSIGNELSANPSAGARHYFDEQAKRIRRLDSTRPVSLVILGYPRTGCHRSAYKEVDMLGVNTYFGWYPGPNDSTSDRHDFGPYLDRLRKCYRDKAIADSEFGAEANRHGRTKEPGTYEFQSKWVDYTLGVLAKKDWLSGAIGMLIEFHVRPGWSGGNPHPSPPMHQKGVFYYDLDPKPAAAAMSDWYHKAKQYDLPLP
jgi:beta-glucuronidase